MAGEKMGMEKFPLSSEIPWDQINEVRVTSDGGAYSFEFEVAGKKQKMTVTIGLGQTEFTLSKQNGSPIIHAIQKGRVLRVLDFTNKLKLQSAK
jgi:hypothetical protein